MQPSRMAWRLLVMVVATLLLGACGSLNLPQLFPNPPREPAPEPKSCSASNKELELSEASDFELAVGCLVINHPEQARDYMHYHPVLGALARERAQGMAEHGFYSGHLDPHGYGPNHYLCQSDYRPMTYCSDDPTANWVESIAAGFETPEAVVAGWYDSPGHRIHILGQVPAFAEATHYGVGYAPLPSHKDPETNFRWHWVFIAALPPE